MGEGLRRGQRCCILAPAALRAALCARLREFGVDVEGHFRTHTLQFPPEAQDAAPLLDWARKFFEEAEDAHAPGIRWLEEGRGASPAGISLPQVCELHACLNYLVKQYPSAALCLYDIERVDVPHLLSAIAAHRHLLVEGTLVRDNPFYIPAERFLSLSPEDRQRDLRNLFREVGFDVAKLLSALAGYGELQEPASP